VEGGPWLVNRVIRVYWDAEAQWFEAKVVRYDSSVRAVDAHGNQGPVHELEYEDGEFSENLETAKWQYDLSEGAPVLKIRSGKGSKDKARRGPGSGADLPGWDKECDKLLGRLMRQEKAWPFLEPVDPEALHLPDYFNIIQTPMDLTTVKAGFALHLPNYFDIIQTPMDLTTVKAGLDGGRYTNPGHLLDDIALTFHNALSYNPETDMVYKMARDLVPIFDSLCSGSSLLRQVQRTELPAIPRQTALKPAEQPLSPKKESAKGEGGRKEKEQLKEQLKEVAEPKKSGKPEEIRSHKKQAPKAGEPPP
ncbi:hypothetical protein T484DRAFT_1796159, partial [Baffinella frigidus]